MSTHNIFFREEIREILVFMVEKKAISVDVCNSFTREPHLERIFFCIVCLQ